LRALGARSVPVVSRGKEYVFGQMLKDVAKFIGVDYDTKPKLSPQQLIDKLDMIMDAAKRFVAQIPEAQLDANMRNRERPIRNLCYHIFRLEEAFMDVVENDIYLTRDLLNQLPPPEIRTTKDLIAYGERVQKRLHDWWDRFDDKDCEGEVDSYYGRQPLHNVLERHTWHPAQHVRQLMLLLEEDNGIKPDRPLTDKDFEGLPIPKKAWDDEAA
jgi:DinB superfamily